jgi:delta 1-pyrroline-5-carboxylate dehydrogenase
MLRLTQKIVFSPTIYKISSLEQLKLVRMMSSLVKNQAFINGQWVDGIDKKKFKVTNPANFEVVGEVPDMTADDAKIAIDKAYETFHSKKWQNTTAKERSAMLKVN